MGFLDPKPQTTAGLDAATAARINDAESDTATALAAAILELGDASYVAIGSVVSGPDIVCVGDSLTQAGGFLQRLATLTGRTVRNAGVGGEDSAAIAARQGGNPYLMLPAGGSFPASGTVNVTLTTPGGGSTSWPLLQGDGGGVTGVVAGIPGTIGLVKDPAVAYPTHSALDQYTFTRTTAGTAVAAGTPQPFVYDFGEARRGDVQILWPGQNGPDDDRTVAEASAMVDHLTPTTPGYVMMTQTGVDSTGESNLEKRLTAAHGPFINIRRYLIDSALADADITPTGTDTTDIAEGRVPVSLRTDGVHHTMAAQRLIGTQVFKKAVALGLVRGAPVRTFVDTFNRANSLTGLGVSSSGLAWLDDPFEPSTWGITSNTAYVVDGAGQSYDVASIGRSDASVSVKIGGSSAADMGLVLRWVNRNNSMLITFNEAGKIKLYKTVDASSSSIPAWEAPAPVVGDTVRVDMLGDLFTIYINGAKVIQASDSTHLDNHYHGLWAYQSAGPGAARWEDFSITAL